MSLLLGCAITVAQTGPPDNGVEQVPLQQPNPADPDLPDPSDVLEAPTDAPATQQGDATPSPDSAPPADEPASQSAQAPDTPRDSRPRLKLDATFSSMETSPPTPPRHAQSQ